MDTCVLCKKEFVNGIKKAFTTDPEMCICSTCFERISYIKQFSKADGNIVAEKSFSVLSGYLSNIEDVVVSDRLVQLLSEYDSNLSFEERSLQAQERAKENVVKMEREYAKRKAREEKENFDFLMTSANNLEGYRITRQLGLVFGETFFKNSLVNSILAGVKDIGSSIKSLAKSTEMSGSMELLQESRQYALDKIKDDTKSRGGNAIISVDAETSLGDGLVHIMVYGTAVFVEPIFDEE